jgi:hypothetical protein
MTTPTRDSSSGDEVLGRIGSLSSEAEYTDAEAREALADEGVEPEILTRAVRERVRLIVTPPRWRFSWEAVRACALGLTAVSAAGFVVVLAVNAHAMVAAQRELARAQLMSPLLSGLASDDPERRSVALVITQEVDPAFAAETSKQLAQWDVNTRAETRTSQNAIYETRFVAGLEKLELSRDPNDRKAAIWSDLLPVLLDARKNRDDFVDVAIDYQRVLPLLRVRDPEVFLDSYWGELWILNILLESKIAPVVEAARRQAPEPAVVEHIYQQHAASLDERDRKAFEEAVAVYEDTLKGLR